MDYDKFDKWEWHLWLAILIACAASLTHDPVSSGYLRPLVIESGKAFDGLMPTQTGTSTYHVGNPNPVPVKITEAVVSKVDLAGGKDATTCVDAKVADVTATASAAIIGKTIPAFGRLDDQAISVFLGRDSDDSCQRAVMSPTVEVTAEVVGCETMSGRPAPKTCKVRDALRRLHSGRIVLEMPYPARIGDVRAIPLCRDTDVLASRHLRGRWILAA